jgi:predicted MFS family arabinose efflux permease
VFAVFYAVFGIPLGRLTDSWIRTNLISIGLLFWSLMTALSGTARRFASLATYRIGVGIYYLWPWLLGASVLSTHARRQRQ